MLKDEKSTISGLLFLVLGCGLISYSLSTLETGTVVAIGPGYFPIVVGAGLVVCGAAVLASMGETSRILFSQWPWREICCIAAAILLFAVGLNYLGFLAACFLMVFVAACARRDTTFLYAAAVAAALTLFCTIVFVWGIGIPFRLY